MIYKELNAYNLDIVTQIKMLEKIIILNENINTAIERAKTLSIENYYIGAGCITQTVWNYLFNKPLKYGINDIDFVYFDDDKIDIESEKKMTSTLKNLYSDLKIKVDVVNEASVHLWYEKQFGYSIKPYTSLESAINTWPTTATSIGVRRDKNNKFIVYAPFGLNDLFGKIVRANKIQITKEIYENKVQKWINKWPDLTVIPWDKQ